MVGILFTTVIPLFIYVNSVDNYYDTTVVNMGIADQERSMEDLIFYAYGKTDDEDEDLINLFIINQGSITVNVVHVWVVREDLEETLVFTSQNVSIPINGEDLPLQINPSNQVAFGNLTVTSILDPDPNKNYFNVYITTARGNKFSSSTNPLHKNGGGWGTSGNWPWIDVRINSGDGSNDFTIRIICDTIGFDEYWYAFKINGPYSLVRSPTRLTA
jgi:hypothetical protein